MRFHLECHLLPPAEPHQFPHEQPGARQLRTRSIAGCDVVMSGEIWAPSHDGLVEELRLLRERGLIAIRGLTLPHLSAATRLAGESLEEEPTPVEMERVLRDAVDKLGGGDLQRSAEYAFGTPPGMRGTPAVVRRRRAAEVYGVTPERFRKAQERLLISQLADMILDLSSHQRGHAIVGELASSGPRLSDTRQEGRAFGLWTRPMRSAHGRHIITLHVGPVEMLADIDIVVSSENVYFEGSQTFKPSLSAALRLACATRNAVGGILDDVILRELTEWVEKNGHRGLPMAAGTIAATSSGELRRQNIRRIYHAAIVSPRPGESGYNVVPDAIPRAVKNAMLLASRERETVNPPFKSICFPLFGSGSGGLTQSQSLSWIWASLEREQADGWDLHLLTREITSMELNGWQYIDNKEI